MECEISAPGRIKSETAKQLPEPAKQLPEPRLKKVSEQSGGPASDVSEDKWYESHIRRKFCAIFLNLYDICRVLSTKEHI